MTEPYTRPPPEQGPVSIRPARRSDLPSLVALRDRLNAHELAGSPHAPIVRLSVEEFAAVWGPTLDSAVHCWRVLEAAGQPVGFGLIYLQTPETRPPGAFLHWAYLEPVHRRQGLGQFLLDDLLAWARSQGANRVELQFIEGNESARSFWMKTGFRPYARRCVRYFEDR